jgi:hypothetical protein
MRFSPNLAMQQDLAGAPPRPSSFARENRECADGRGLQQKRRSPRRTAPVVKLFPVLAISRVSKMT